MNTIRKVWGALHLIWGLLVFVSGMLVVLPFIFLAALLFRGRTAVRMIFFFLNIWGVWIMLGSLIPIRTYGKQYIKKGASYIFVSNHNSYLDAPSIVVANPSYFKALGKIEMMKIPIFSIIYKEVCVLIDRSSKESRAESVLQLRREIESGISIFIFPEGTMNKNKELPLAEFYDGAFRLAIETQTDIAPMLILNARELLPRDRPLDLRPGVVDCHFLEPISVSGLGPDDLPALKEKVHSIMKEAMLARQ